MGDGLETVKKRPRSRVVGGTQGRDNLECVPSCTHVPWVLAVEEASLCKVAFL